MSRTAKEKRARRTATLRAEHWVGPGRKGGTGISIDDLNSWIPGLTPACDETGIAALIRIKNRQFQKVHARRPAETLTRHEVVTAQLARLKAVDWRA
jgi:hypothetical protein